MIGEPPSLDLHATTAVITQQISWHVLETLYTYDRNFNPIPFLAESHTVADGGRRYTIALRKGVKLPQRQGDDLGRRGGVAPALGQGLHPGQARLEGRRGGGGQGPVHRGDPPEGALGLAPLRARPAQQRRRHLPRRTRSPPPATARSRTRSAPGRTASSSTSPTATSSSRASRSTRRGPTRPTGYGGKRTAYIDEILFIPVPDVAVRLAGVETGEYHFGQQIKQDQYDRVKGIAGLEPRVVKPSGWTTAVLNHKQGMMTNKKLRQAFQAALDMEPIMAAGFGNKEFYRLDGALFYPEQTAWHTQAAVTPLQPEEPGEGEEAPPGGGLQGRAGALDQHARVRVDVQERARGQAAAGGGRLQGRPPGGGLGHARPAPQQARAVRRLLDRLHLHRRPRAGHEPPVQLAGLVVPRGEGEAPDRDGPRDRPEEAQGADRAASRRSSTRTSAASSSATTSRST